MTGDTSLFDLSGRTAVVTGGNGGIGRAIAIGLAWLARAHPWLYLRVTRRRITVCLRN